MLYAYPFLTHVLKLLTLNSRLRILGKAVAGRVAINTGDLVQPSRQTRHSDSDLSFTTLAARILFPIDNT